MLASDYKLTSLGSSCTLTDMNIEQTSTSTFTGVTLEVIEDWCGGRVVASHS